MPLIYDDDGGYLAVKGRGSLFYYSANGGRYEINSEMVASNEYDIAVYPSADVLADERRVVTGSEKAEVISRVKALCEKGRIRIKVFE